MPMTIHTSKSKPELEFHILLIVRYICCTDYCRWWWTSLSVCYIH